MIFVYILNMSYAFKFKSELRNQKCALKNIQSSLFSTPCLFFGPERKYILVKLKNNNNKWSHKFLNVTWDFWKNTVPFFPVTKNLANFCKDKRSSYKILFTMPCLPTSEEKKRRVFL